MEPLQKTCLVKVLVCKDWWSVWMSLMLFVPAIVLALTCDISAIDPKTWTTAPTESWTSHTQVAAFVVLVAASICVIALAVTTINVLSQRLKGRRGRPAAEAARNTAAMAVVAALALAARWLGEQASIAKYGITFEVWALLFGMLVSNTVSLPKWMEAAKKGEFFVKVGLVLLGLDLRSVASLGGPGILSSWVPTPIVIITSALLGFYLLGMRKDRALVLILVTGASVCGSSAATAIYGCVGGRQDALTLAVAIINLMTIPQMIGNPYVAYYAGMTPREAGAWLGTTVDSTGSVVAAGTIYDGLSGCKDSDNCAVNVASTVKMVQNILIGPIAVAVSLYWIRNSSSNNNSEEGAAARGEAGDRGLGATLKQLWNKFPKFVLGFLFCSAVLTAIDASDKEAKATLTLTMSAVSKWFFCLGFVGIGLDTNVRSLAKKMQGGKPILLYLIAQGIDLLLKLGMSMLSFGVISRRA